MDASINKRNKLSGAPTTRTGTKRGKNKNTETNNTGCFVIFNLLRNSQKNNANNIVNMIFVNIMFTMLLALFFYDSLKD